jgi:ATP-dependent helicase/DNAse subunit B
LREVLARPEGPSAPGTAWSAGERARLHSIAEQLCNDYEARGLTGRRLFWHRDRRRILADLDRFLVEDARVRDDFALHTVATELQFGLPGSSRPAVEVVVSAGRTVRFRGAADRVDCAADGTLWVIDYKTGRSNGLDPDDPIARGTRLQLPVYAHAARAA